MQRAVRFDCDKIKERVRSSSNSLLERLKVISREDFVSLLLERTKNHNFILEDLDVYYKLVDAYIESKTSLRQGYISEMQGYYSSSATKALKGKNYAEALKYIIEILNSSKTEELNYSEYVLIKTLISTYNLVKLV